MRRLLVCVLDVGVTATQLADVCRCPLHAAKPSCAATHDLHPRPLPAGSYPSSRFAFARTLHAGFPAAFAWVERFSWALAGLVDDTRPMDAMPLSLDTPAEDEIGACLGAPCVWWAAAGLAGCEAGLGSPSCNPHQPCPRCPAAMSAVAGVSAYLPLCWMRDWRRFASLYDFQQAPEQDLRAWRDTALWFWKKVTWRWGGCRPLVIKSPVHTARVALLLAMFPRARFVFVHRDPLTTFASAGHMANTYYWYTALQRQTEEDVTGGEWRREGGRRAWRLLHAPCPAPCRACCCHVTHRCRPRAACLRAPCSSSTLPLSPSSPPEFILDQGERLHAAYLRDRALIPQGARPTCGGPAGAVPHTSTACACPPKPGAKPWRGSSLTSAPSHPRLPNPLRPSRAAGGGVVC